MIGADSDFDPIIQGLLKADLNIIRQRRLIVFRMTRPSLPEYSTPTVFYFTNYYLILPFHTYRIIFRKKIMMNIRPALFCMLFVAITASAASSRDVPDIQVSAKQEKTNATLNLDKAAVAAMIDKETFDGMVGVTSDFQHTEVPAYVVFNESVTEEKLMQLANFQGRLKGVVQCKRIRLGTSPLFPQVKLGVLAEQCMIKSLNH